MIILHVKRPSNALHLGGDNMPSRSDQVYRMRKRTAEVYLVGDTSHFVFEYMRLTSIRSECDATI